MDDNYFIKNAIRCWLHYYGDKGHKWDAIYKELEQRENYTQPSPPQRRTRVKKANSEGV